MTWFVWLYFSLVCVCVCLELVFEEVNCVKTSGNKTDSLQAEQWASFSCASTLPLQKDQALNDREEEENSAFPLAHRNLPRAFYIDGTFRFRSCFLLCFRSARLKQGTIKRQGLQRLWWFMRAGNFGELNCVYRPVERNQRKNKTNAH